MSTTTHSTKPVQGPIQPAASVTAMRATAMAALPSSSAAWRPIRTPPAIDALSPSRPARLNTLDPRTTPTPIEVLWLSTATAAVEISGASAPSAVRMPSRPSVMPSRTPIRSSSRDNTKLAPMLTARLTANTRAQRATQHPWESGGAWGGGCGSGMVSDADQASRHTSGERTTHARIRAFTANYRGCEALSNDSACFSWR